MKSLRVLAPLALGTVLVLAAGCGRSTQPTSAVTPTPDGAPPSAPTGLGYVSDPATGSDMLTWTANSEPSVSGYQVYIYSPSPTRDNSYIMMGETPASETSYALPPVSADMVQYLRVRAVDNTGSSSAMSSTLQADRVRRDGSVGSGGGSGGGHGKQPIE